jgi:type III secretory pathway component EscT
VEAFSAAGLDLSRLGLAWARVSPTVAIVPAFGLRALPTGARAVIALALAAAIFPAVDAGFGAAHVDATGIWPVLALQQVLLGLPVALAAAVPLWAATMAGGVADALRNANQTLDMATVEEPATPLGVPLSLLASAIFLATGGPARVAMALALRPASAHPLLAASNDIAAGITVAVAIGGPLLAAAVVLEVAGALIARAASPAQIHLLLAPLRAIALLGVMAVVLERVSAVLAVAVERAPGGI